MLTSASTCTQHTSMRMCIYHHAIVFTRAHACVYMCMYMHANTLFKKKIARDHCEAQTKGSPKPCLTVSPNSRGGHSVSVSRAKGQKSTYPCQKGVPDKRPEGNLSILQTKRHGSFTQPGAGGSDSSGLCSCPSKSLTF